MTDTLGGVHTPNRLTAIEITNYRGYSGMFRFDLPKGENLIVYGENGSGKSSFYHSLRTFLEAPDLRVRVVEGGKARVRSVAIGDSAYRFTTEAPALQLEFGPQIFEWTRTKNDTGDKVVRLLNQGKGFLDYKALLDVYYVRESDDGVVDLFPLFIRRLLPYYTYPSGSTTLTFQEGWASLRSKVRARWYGGDEADLRNELRIFNEALEQTVNDLGVRTTTMLKAFGDEFAVEFSFTRAEFQKGPKRIVGPRLLVKPAYRKLEIADYHDFFNEAKLSALAICMFFAALKDSPATGLRLLALDDVLIGLDMSNRAKVLDLVHEHFSQWQIFILTYSKAWFESLKDKVKTLKWAADWIPIVLWEERAAADDSPRIVAEGSGDLLEMAARHLRRKDFTAAAVYARKALEFSCHKTCARASLKVVHVEGAKDRQLQDFLDALRVRVTAIADAPRRANALDLLIRLERAKAFVLNPNAHFDVQEEDVLSVEVATGLQAVKEFIEFAEAYSWKKNEGRGLMLSRRDELRFKIAEVRAKLVEREIADAQNAMKDAHSIFWQLYGAKLGVSLQMGVAVTPWTVWRAAEQQRKLLDAVQARLLAARPYLSGSVETRDFDIAECEDAILLLEELSAPFLLPAASN